MFHVEISELAALELTDAHDWYESRVEGLGQRLLREFDAVRSTLHDRPLMHSVVGGNTRRALLRKFPYGVFFVVKGDKVVITSFFHSSRRPRRRLDD